MAFKRFNIPERINLNFNPEMHSVLHGIGFSYFKVHRESILLDIDETLDEVRITGRVVFSDDTRFYNLFYGHTLYEDDRSRVQGNLGLNVLDLRYVLEAVYDFYY